MSTTESEANFTQKDSKAELEFVVSDPMINDCIFHKPDSSVFNVGKTWISSSGSIVTVLYVLKYKYTDSDTISDYEVCYADSDGAIRENDCWNFQVRYNPTN